MRDHLSQLLETTVGGVRWQMLPECRDGLLGPEGLYLSDWLASGQAHVVKHGPHQTVYRVSLPGLNFYVKHYRLPNLRARLRLWIRPSKARMEYGRALSVAARGVPTVTPLALGEACSGADSGESFLITRALENTEPLSAFVERLLPTFPAARQARVRQRLAEALGELVARMHDAGILHKDLHPGNVLVQLDEEDRPRLYLIDLHPVYLGRPLGWRASRANLVILNRWFMLRAGRPDRLRFWRSYNRRRTTGPWAEGAPHKAESPLARTSPALRQQASDRARELEELAWKSNLGFWRHRDGRCVRSGRYFKPIRSGAVQGFVVGDVVQEALAGLLADPQAPFSRADAVILKDSPDSTVVELDLTIHGRKRRVIYKRFRAPGWLGLLGQAPALRAWVRGHGLRERLLATPRPLAVFHRHCCGLPREGYLVLEKVAEAVTLPDLLADLEQLPREARCLARRRWVGRVAVLVRSLHRRNLSHGELEADNLLVTPAAEQVWLIDLTAATLHPSPRRGPRVQDLARLHASLLRLSGLSRTDKLRFLRAYLSCRPFNRDCWKVWWRDVGRLTQEMLAPTDTPDRPLPSPGLRFRVGGLSRV